MRAVPVIRRGAPTIARSRAGEPAGSRSGFTAAGQRRQAPDPVRDPRLAGSVRGAAN